MNVASLELCKELYELSGWRLTYFNHHQFQNHSSPIESRHIVHTTLGDNNYGLELEGASYIYQLEITPAYDLGFLLRKLPYKFPNSQINHWLTVSKGANSWVARYSNREDFVKRADTPEDAAAKLAIELLKSGVLTSEHQTEARASSEALNIGSEAHQEESKGE